MEEDSRESSGVTLEELARLAHASGCRCALNMDGGGSANIQYIFGHLIRGAIDGAARRYLRTHGPKRRRSEIIRNGGLLMLKRVSMFLVVLLMLMRLVLLAKR